MSSSGSANSASDASASKSSGGGPASSIGRRDRRRLPPRLQQRRLRQDRRLRRHRLGGVSPGASTRAVPPRHRIVRPPAATLGRLSAASSGPWAAISATASTARRTGASACGRGEKLLAVGYFGVPDRAAAYAAHPAPIRPQACRVDVVRCSAIRADDQHWRIGRIRGAAPLGEPSRRSVNGLETKPARQARCAAGC